MWSCFYARTLGSVLLFVDVDWDLLVRMRKGQPCGKVRAWEESDASRLPLAASLSSFPLHRGARACMHTVSCSPFQTGACALESATLNEETATPGSSSCPFPGLMLCLAVAAGLRGNTLCFPWVVFELKT